MDSSPSQLSALQQRFLAEFARRAPGFFLTGGAVLAGWVLCHRRTDDLDLFTVDDDAMAQGDTQLRSAAAAVGAEVEALQTSADFRRYLLRTPNASVVVDLVRERVAQLHPKLDRDGLRLDPVEEIVANKICALVGRAEPRDLVDVMMLEERGYRVENFLPDAAAKDAGVTAAALAWALSTFPLRGPLPEGFSRERIDRYRGELEHRMRQRAGHDAGA
ncbi:MAG: nucleotidyl transferase AbiEii/AbiGii toxin family protein [Deltaproteobacteria bacterium]|nr:nucleotidyl transferase AbiEii/AbiGii toxin family protein [Deltaproteobacteria bacterium]